MKLLIWGVTAVLALCWTAMAGGVALLLAASGDWLATGGAVDWAAWLTHWSLPSVLVGLLDAQWLQAMQLLLVRLLESLQGAWPDLGRLLKWFVPLVGLVWLVGMAVLLMLALGLHLLVRRGGPPVPPAGTAAGTAAAR